MDLQFIFNSRGERSGVYIPIDLWDSLKERFKDLKKVEEQDLDLLNELESSFKQVNLIREGKLPKQSLKNFIDEL